MGKSISSNEFRSTSALFLREELETQQVQDIVLVHDNTNVSLPLLESVKGDGRLYTTLKNKFTIKHVSPKS